jgi:hypothetical protein
MLRSQVAVTAKNRAWAMSINTAVAAITREIASVKLASWFEPGGAVRLTVGAVGDSVAR